MLTDLAAIFSDAETGPGPEFNTVNSRPEKKIGRNTTPQITINEVNSNSGNFESIEETIARIKRDVYVTGVIIGAPGKEAALFKIEGMLDRSFKINTQLMDGFIITEITNDHVMLKNQIGDESFSLNVGNNGRDAVAELLSEEVVGNEMPLLPGGDIDPDTGGVVGEQLVNPSQYFANAINEQNYPSDMTELKGDGTPISLSLSDEAASTELGLMPEIEANHGAGFVTGNQPIDPGQYDVDAISGLNYSSGIIELKGDGTPKSLSLFDEAASTELGLMPESGAVLGGQVGASGF